MSSSPVERDGEKRPGASSNQGPDQKSPQGTQHVQGFFYAEYIYAYGRIRTRERRTSRGDSSDSFT